MGLRVPAAPAATSTASRPSCESAFEHFPPCGTAGIQKFVNGPFTFSPDGNPLVGPIRGHARLLGRVRVMAGLSQGGGVGLALANWMVARRSGDGDIWAMDVARYGDYATLAYTNAKVRENYWRRFRITFPNEELPGAPAAAHHPDLRPAHRGERGVGRVVRARARAVVPGAGQGADRGGHVPPSATRGTRVAEEVAAVRERVGLTEISNFAKYHVIGAGRRGVARVAAHQPDAGASGASC